MALPTTCVVALPTTCGFQPTPARIRNLSPDGKQLEHLRSLDIEALTGELRCLKQERIEILGAECFDAELSQCGLLLLQTLRQSARPICTAVG